VKEKGLGKGGEEEGKWGWERAGKGRRAIGK